MFQKTNKSLFTSNHRLQSDFDESTKLSCIFYKLLSDDNDAKYNANECLLSIESVFIKRGFMYTCDMAFTLFYRCPFTKM